MTELSNITLPAAPNEEARRRVSAVGAVLGGIAAMSCCVLPLVFVLVGISGAWIGNLTALSPYQPAFIAVALGFIGYGHLSAYRARKACAAEAECALPMRRGWVDFGLWTGTAFVAIAAAFSYLTPLFLS